MTEEKLQRLTLDGVAATTRPLAIEAPVAIEIDGIGYAVMMATPADLDAFARGFVLTERLADTPADIIDVDPFEAETGWIVRVALAPHCRARVHDRVRHRTTDASCGLCGIASLEQLRRPLPDPPPAPTTSRNAVFAALAALRNHQPLNAATGAVHAAAACSNDGDILAAYEDVGRHNALDKLIGSGTPLHGFILVTSRLSFEMIDKALVARTPLLVGISAPTSMAVEHAGANRLTTIALARPDAMLVASDPHGVFS